MLTSEITALPMPGHTPGSMGLAIVSGGQRALLIGDVTTNPAQVTEPDWAFAFDMDPARAVQTRKQMIERAETENALLIAPFPTLGMDGSSPGGPSLLAGEGCRQAMSGVKRHETLSRTERALHLTASSVRSCFAPASGNR